MNQKNLFNCNNTVTHPYVVCFVPGSGANKLKKVLSGRYNLTPLSHEKNTLITQTAVVPNFNNQEQNINKTDIKTYQSAKDSSPYQSLYNIYPKISEISQLPAVSQDEIIIVTHCMKSEILQHQFVGKTIIKIFGDVMLALRRWYVVYCQHQDYPNPGVSDRWNPWLNLFKHNPAQLHIAHQILFHLEYYQTHWDFDCDYFVDISLNDCYFSRYMNNEYQQCQNEDFDTVAAVLHQSPEVQSILQFLNTRPSTF